jgi:hypothetical protein
MKVNGITIDEEQIEVELDNVNFFGTDVERHNDKKGNFKSFHTHTWVKESGQKIYVSDMKITDLKQYFRNYSSSKRLHTEEKNGKAKKATEWNCEVIEEGTISLNDDQMNMVHEANKKRRLFTLNGVEYFFLIDNLFRNNSDNYYYMFDYHNSRLVRLNYQVTDHPSKNDLLREMDKYSEQSA